MMNVEYQSARLFILLRLLVVTSIFLFGDIIFEFTHQYFYFFVILAYLLSIIYILSISFFQEQIRKINFLQIAIDLLLTAFIVHVTGGIDSVFSILYVFSLMSSCLLLSLNAGMVIGATIFFLYAGVNGYLIFDFQKELGLSLSSLPVQTKLYKLYVHCISYAFVTVLFYLLVIRVRNMEKRMKWQEEMVWVGKVSSQIAHEIRNPLTAISGSVEVLQERIFEHLSEKDKVLMDVIVKESDRVSGILSSFLNYSDFDKCEKMKVDVKEVLNQTLLLFENQLDSKKITFRKDYENDPVVIEVDPNKMKQVFINILKNAMEAMKENGEIEVDVVLKDHQVMIVFIDNGPGIRPSRIKHLFSLGTTHEKESTGIGLYIANKIVKQHQGQIQVISKEEQGTIFQVVLPITKVA